MISIFREKDTPTGVHI